MYKVCNFFKRRRLIEKKHGYRLKQRGNLNAIDSMTKNRSNYNQ